MNKSIFVRQELPALSDVEEKVLREWEELGFFKPVGYTPDREPFYSDRTLERIVRVRGLLGLGYGPEEILKIVKKVGLPGIHDGKNDSLRGSDYLTVGDLAEKADISPRTLKHWEDKGIIEPQMRSGGGFRLYSKSYIELCRRIKDLQLFGYTLEEIKALSDLVRDFLAIQNGATALSDTDGAAKLDLMLAEVQSLQDKMRLLRAGIGRWEALIRKSKKEVLGIKEKLRKRSKKKKGKKA